MASMIPEKLCLEKMLKMRIISTTDISREGNDCYIYESVSLVEQFDVYAVITCQRITGWAKREGMHVLDSTTDYTKAKKAYKKYGGTFEKHDPFNTYF
jgi:hypothetical protein